MTASRVAPRRRILAIEQPIAAPTAALWLALAVAAAVLLYAGRHLTFFYDEWTFITERRGSGVGTYLDPHNGHLSLVPVLVYKALFKLVGLRHYTPYRVVAVAVELACASVLYLLARRRVGPWLALVPTILLVFMGTAFQDLLWPFQIGYLGSLATGLGALALIDDPARARDGWSAALLASSVASSGVGITFLVAAAVTLIAGRSRWQRLWIVAVPLALYLIWYAGWSSGDTITSDAVLLAPQYVANAVAGVAAGIAGLDDATWGAPLAAALAAVLVGSWRARRLGNPTPMLLAALAGALSFWVLTAVTRASFAEPAASRYVYVGAVFVWLALAESRLGVGWTPAWLALAGLVALGALVANLQVLRAGERGLRSSDASVQTSLAAVDVAAPVVSPAFLPDPTNAPQLTAGSYLAAAHDLGSPAFTIAQLEGTTEAVRAHADQVLAHAERLALTPSRVTARGAAAPGVTGTVGGTASTSGRCDRFQPGPSGGYVDLFTRSDGELVIRPSPGSTAVVYLRRFASGFDSGPLGTVSDAGAVLKFPPDLAPRVDWNVRIGAQRALTACSA